MINLSWYSVSFVPRDPKHAESQQKLYIQDSIVAYLIIRHNPKEFRQYNDSEILINSQEPLRKLNETLQMKYRHVANITVTQLPKNERDENEPDYDKPIDKAIESIFNERFERLRYSKDTGNLASTKELESIVEEIFPP